MYKIYSYGDNIMKKKVIQKNKGFVILFAMLISTLILLITAGIFTVVQKEVVLSSYARESQRAFYAADSALECALYSDYIGFQLDGANSSFRTPFSANPASGSWESYSNIPDYSCGGTEMSSYHLLNSGGTALYEVPYVFRYQNTFNNTDSSCAYVLIEKELKGDPDPILNVTETRITAVGFNVCDGNVPDFDDPTLLERRLSLTYNTLIQ